MENYKQKLLQQIIKLGETTLESRDVCERAVSSFPLNGANSSFSPKNYLPINNGNLAQKQN